MFNAQHAIRVASDSDTAILRSTPNRSGDAPKPTEDEFYANAPKKGMFRLTPPRAIAETVWRAYGSDKLRIITLHDSGRTSRARLFDDD